MKKKPKKKGSFAMPSDVGAARAAVVAKMKGFRNAGKGSMRIK